jgi:hypothetical protein
MPVNYENDEPELYDYARSLFFYQGIKSPAKIRMKLTRRFGKNKAPTWKTVDRWCHAWEQEKSIASSVDKLTTSQASSDSATTEPFIQDIEATSWSGYELFKPPELAELIEQDLDAKIALRLLANWDVAYRKGDESGAFETAVLRRAVPIFSEFPEIPYEKAIAIAELEVQGEEFQLEEVRDYVQLAKRYRVWRGPDNLKAFDEVFSRLHPLPQVTRRRQKRVAKGILSRLFSRGQRD